MTMSGKCCNGRHRLMKDITEGENNRRGPRQLKSTCLNKLPRSLLDIVDGSLSPL